MIFIGIVLLIASALTLVRGIYIATKTMSEGNGNTWMANLIKNVIIAGALFLASVIVIGTSETDTTEPKNESPSQEQALEEIAIYALGKERTEQIVINDSEDPPYILFKIKIRQGFNRESTINSAYKDSAKLLKKLNDEGFYGTTSFMFMFETEGPDDSIESYKVISYDVTSDNFEEIDFENLNFRKINDIISNEYINPYLR